MPLTFNVPQNQTFPRNFRISRNSENVLGKYQGALQNILYTVPNIQIPSPSKTPFEHCKWRRERFSNLIFRLGKTYNLFKCVGWSHSLNSSNAGFFPVNCRCPGMALAPKSPQQVTEKSLRFVRKFLLCLRHRYICCRIIAINALI